MWLWKDVRDAVARILESTTLADLVNHPAVAGARLRNQFQADALLNAAERDQPHTWLGITFDAEHFPRNGQTHMPISLQLNC